MQCKMRFTPDSSMFASQNYSKPIWFYPLLWLICFTSNVYSLYDIDTTKYEEGKRQFELIQKNGMLPKYGLCWTDTMKALVSGCKHLSDVEQSRLALSYLNCFLLVQGRRHYNCDPSDDIKTCTAPMADADSASYAIFFTHTQNICYFLEAQVWHENTERTINLLSSSSEAVADQLEQSSHLQHEVLQQQKISLENQDRILDQASNLSSIINTSTNNIQDLFTEFKETTNEQRQLITDIFDRVSQLQSTVLGEFSWFYSFIYYVLSTVMCYISTSTPRTSGARFWLFCLMALNAFTENFLINFATDGSIFLSSSESSPSQSENIYRFQWICRKLSACVGLAILIYYAVTFQDINLINNKLLTEIKSQIEELRNWLKDINLINNKLLTEIKSQIEELRNWLKDINLINNKLLTEIKSQIEELRNWLKDMLPPQTSGRELTNNTQNMVDQAVPHKYLLRQRKSKSIQGNPALQSVTP